MQQLAAAIWADGKSGEDYIQSLLHLRFACDSAILYLSTDIFASATTRSTHRQLHERPTLGLVIDSDRQLFR